MRVAEHAELHSGNLRRAFLPPSQLLPRTTATRILGEMIWREGDTQYYPGGVTDPNYCVLKFTATDGRFYSDFYPRSFVL